MVFSKCELTITCCDCTVSHYPPYSHCQTYTLPYMPLSHPIHPEDDDCQNARKILGWIVCMCMCMCESGGEGEVGMDDSSLQVTH